MDIKLTFFGVLALLVIALVGGGMAANSANSPYAPDVDQAGRDVAAAGESFVESFPITEPTVGSESIAPNPQVIPTLETIGGEASSGGMEQFPANSVATPFIESVNPAPTGLTVLVMQAMQQAGSWTGNSPSETQIDVTIISDTELGFTVYFVYVTPSNQNLQVAGFGTTQSGMNVLTDANPALDQLTQNLTTWARDYGVPQEYVDNVVNDIEFFKLYLQGVDNQHSGLDTENNP